MNIIDIAFIIFILLGMLIGWKQGFTKSLVSCIGYIVVLILAFILKDPVGEFLMPYLPFFDFFGIIKGITVLNIALYQLIAFLLIFTLLLILLKFVMIATNLFEGLLKFTVVLGIPSKILGALCGGIRNFVISFMILYILTLPTLVNNDAITQSKFARPILDNTPVLSIFADNAMVIANEFTEIKDNYEKMEPNEFNKKTLELFLKYDIVKASTVRKLIEKDKIVMPGAEKVLKKYS